MPLLAKAYIEQGVPVEPASFIETVWKGYYSMVNNDGSCTNEEAFWKAMEGKLPVEGDRSREIALEFYGNAFNQAKASTSPTPLADQIVKNAKGKGIQVYLATNPVFPRCATMNRIQWAGLQAEDFRIITTYEDQYYCKPNVEYFRAILEQFQLNPEECLMVGNDVKEDLAIRALGVQTFLVTDTMENKMNLAYETEYSGTMRDLLAFVDALPANAEA